MLTQEQIQQMMASGLGGVLRKDGLIYTPTMTSSDMGGENNFTGGQTFAGYNAIPEGWKFGDMAQQYDAQGNRTGEWATTAPDLWDKLGPGLAMSLIGYAGLQGLMGAMGGSGGPMSGFDAGVPTAGEVAAQNTAFSESLSPYLAKGVPQMMGTLELIPESAMPVAPTGYTGPTFGGVSTLLNGGATKAATSMIPGVSDKLLGAGLTAAGALAGKEGTPGQTSERKMDPRLDNYVFGQNGVVPMAAGLLSQQMPMAQQGGQQAFDFGRGLLGRGVAANPFMR